MADRLAGLQMNFPALDAAPDSFDEHGVTRVATAIYRQPNAPALDAPVASNTSAARSCNCRFHPVNSMTAGLGPGRFTCPAVQSCRPPLNHYRFIRNL